MPWSFYRQSVLYSPQLVSSHTLFMCGVLDESVIAGKAGTMTSEKRSGLFDVGKLEVLFILVVWNSTAFVSISAWCYYTSVCLFCILFHCDRLKEIRHYWRKLEPTLPQREFMLLQFQPLLFYIKQCFNFAMLMVFTSGVEQCWHPDMS